MRWSIRLGSVLGIGIFLHWTFLLLLGWVFFAQWRLGQGIWLALEGVGFILALFGCVVLHELGHALMARRFGIPTRDITLLPIGGIARLERMPREPSRELQVALAGPAVNVVIAAVLFLVLFFARGMAPMREMMRLSGDFLGQLMWVNVFLVVFNLLPAFPMDGGRVLRALLARYLNYAQATHIAARVGQVMAVVLAAVGLFVLNNPFLLLIALFVFVGAQVEARMVSVSSRLQAVPVTAAMVKRFRSLSGDDSLQSAVNELLAGAQQDFPVVAGDRVLGVLTRTDLVRALATSGPGTKIHAIVRQDCPMVPDDEQLERSYERLRQDGYSTLPVVHDGHLIGLITLENILEWMMVNSALNGGWDFVPEQSAAR